jgi:hypothetical protein
MADKQTAGIGKGTPGPGRPKGSLNTRTIAVKDAIARAAEGLGGVDRLIAWAQEDPQNERAFWSSIYPKLLPVQLTGEDGGPVRMVQRVELVALSGDGTGSTSA